MGDDQYFGVIDLDQTSTKDAPGFAARLRRPWPRPLLVAATAIIAIVATVLAIQIAAPRRQSASSPPTFQTVRQASTSWATLYGSAVLKLGTNGRPVFNGMNAVDSGTRLESTLEAGRYRLEFACASESAGIAVKVLVRGGEGDRAATQADCDQDHTYVVFSIDETIPVSVWVGSYQQASTAYAFAVLAD